MPKKHHAAAQIMGLPRLADVEVAPVGAIGGGTPNNFWHADQAGASGRN